MLSPCFNCNLYFRCNRLGLNSEKGCQHLENGAVEKFNFVGGQLTRVKENCTLDEFWEIKYRLRAAFVVNHRGILIGYKKPKGGAS